ncbi:MAG: hypothetical protein CVV46_04290 [Spirochaetae bacterium HGW-Spirochaetae-2]|jgi:hypothetical protein|nr:MAG: hypothetical protein CVV46_04290 [Spirochaetae bacterium HGW-Spirochaetae-2]
MLPMLFWIRVHDDEHSFAFFIPLILVYLVLAPVYVLAALVYAVMCLLGDETKNARGYVFMLLSLPSLFAAARGTEIDIHSDTSDVTLYVK